MANISLVGLPLSDGAVLDLDQFNDWIYNDGEYFATLRVVDGGLDEDNLHSSFQPGPEHTQRGSHVMAFGASGTANLDYTKHIFNEYDFSESGGWDPGDTDPYEYIPGGCATWYQPWDGYAILQWSIMWQNTNVNSENTRSCIFALLNDTYIESQYRSMSRIGSTSVNPVGYNKARTWTGHAVVPVSAGHNSAGLAVLADYAQFMTRVHAVSFTGAAFKRGDAI